MRTGSYALSVALHVCAVLLPALAISPRATRQRCAVELAIERASEPFDAWRAEPAEPAFEIEALEPLDEPSLVETPLELTPVAVDEPPLRARARPLPPLPEAIDFSKLSWTRPEPVRERRVVPPAPHECVPATAAAQGSAHAEVVRTPARIVSAPRPTYPRLALKRGEQGAVLLLIEVNSAGVVVQVSVETSSGFSSLDRAASDAVWGWCFEPATEGGVAVASSVRHRVVFRMESS